MPFAFTGVFSDAFLLLKKWKFCLIPFWFVLWSHFNFAHSIFLAFFAGNQAKEARSEIIKRATWSRGVLTVQLHNRQIGLLLIQITVCDQTVNMWLCYLFEKHLRIMWCKITNWVAMFIFECQNSLNNSTRTGVNFFTRLHSHATRVSCMPRFCLCSSKILKKLHLFCRLNITAHLEEAIKYLYQFTLVQ